MAYAHLGHMRAMSRETKQRRKKNNKECISFVYRHFPHYYLTEYYDIAASITPIAILAIPPHCPANPGMAQQTPAIARPPCYSEHSDHCFPSCFPSGSSPFLLPAIPKHFCHPGLRHMWAGLPIRQTRDPTKSTDTTDWTRPPLYLLRLTLNHRCTLYLGY